MQFPNAYNETMVSDESYLNIKYYNEDLLYISSIVGLYIYVTTRPASIQSYYSYLYSVAIDVGHWKYSVKWEQGG